MSAKWLLAYLCLVCVVYLVVPGPEHNNRDSNVL